MISGRPLGPGPLNELSRLHGVQMAHRDAVGGGWRVSPHESVFAVLRALGAPLPENRAPTDVELEEACRVRRRALWERVLPPVIVAPDGVVPPLGLRLPEGAPEELRLAVTLEGGERLRLTVASIRRAGRASVDGRPFVVRWIRVDPGSVPDLPSGLHRLRVEPPGGGPEKTLAEVHLLSAPTRTWRPAAAAGSAYVAGTWGVSLPLYALRTGRSTGVGDYGDLGRLGTWAATRGAAWLGTLPLLPLFLDRPFDPSPYAPVTRLFWSELYLDPEDAVRRTGAELAAAYLEGREWARRREAVEREERVDYREAMALRRDLLDRIVGRASQTSEGPRTPAAEGRPLADVFPGLAAYLERRPEAEPYARFRAACERAGGGPGAWEESARSDRPGNGDLRPGRDFTPSVRDRWLVAQWLADQQVEEVTRRASRDGFGLYLDLPLSVHPHGYDVWSRPNLFADSMSVGAPPDAFFREGQDWGFPPVLPHAARTSGYAYLRASVEHVMRRSSALRVDHVMGFHRLYWIPRGAEAAAGVYVRHPAHESYAVLSLLSHRHEAEVIGEDLGTVPPGVRAAMDRHGVGRSYVLPFEVTPRRTPPVSEPFRGCVATLDTHDTWPFAGWWEGRDIEGWVNLGTLDRQEAEDVRRSREEERAALIGWLEGRGRLEAGADHDARQVLSACLEALGASGARAVVLNLEDAWLETRPQNIPGSIGAPRSWRRRAGRTLEDFSGLPEVADLLRRLDAARRGAPAAGARSALET